MKKIYILLLFAAFFIRVQAQNSPGNGTGLVSAIPVAPTAASLGKFGTIQPDICTGIPKIEIPIYQVKCGDITVPISLSYSSGGIKVEELASWAGLGWALNCGGVITRSIRGTADEQTGGYQTNQAHIAAFRAGTMTPAQLITFKQDLMQMSEDGEPDLYTFNFGGNTGTFTFSNSGTFITSPRKHWKIEQMFDGSDFSFKITTENGFQYLFAAEEQSYTLTSGFDESDAPFIAPSAWYLTQIEDTKGNKVTFKYNSVNYGFNTLGAETEFVPKPGSTGNQSWNRYQSATNVLGKQLSSITFNSGTVQFIHSNNARQDAGDTALAAIKAINNNGVVVKNMAFYTSYFGPAPGLDPANYRLRLDSVREESATTTHHLNPYKFTYNNAYTPTVSISQDYWGYNNGKANTQFVRYQTNDGLWHNDRSIDHTQDQIYILQSIIYPTGGSTQFTYEGNDYYGTTPASNSTTQIGHLFGTNDGATDNPHTFNTTFSISSSDYYNGHSYAVVNPIYTIAYGPNPGHALCAVTLTLTGSGGSQTINDTTALHLVAGDYTMAGSIETDVAGAPIATVDMSIVKQTYNPAYTGTITGPGIRVKKIANFIGTKEEDKYYNYNTFGQTYSSGTIADLPGLIYDYTSMSTNVPPNSDFRVFSSGSNYPLINFNGSYVVYGNVTETRDVGGITGKTEYTYTNFNTPGANDVIDEDFPFAPNVSRSYERGLITDKKDYKWTGTAYNPVHEDLYDYGTYNDDHSTNHASYGVKLGTNVFYTYATLPDIIVSGTVVSTYSNTSDIFYQSVQRSREYNAAGTSYTETYKTFDLDTAILETKRVYENLSNGKTHTTTITYPENYSPSGSSSPEVLAINQLKSTHITNPPIEKVTWQKSSAAATDSTVVAAQLQKYLISSVSNSEDITSVPLLNQDLPLANSAPLTDFSPYTGTSMDSRYYINHTINYNPQGNTASVLTLSNSYTGYQWGYQKQYPVAEVKNATDAQFFQQNFEESTGSTITTTGAHTGHNYYNTSYVVPFAVPDSRKYVLSYWYLSGGVWTYSGEIAYTGPVTLTTGSGYDDIRVYPIDASITTFTYEPLLGVTSITDTKGEATFYEYDEFQRLMNVKDKDGNITKNLIYHYFNNN